jgi:hypothetical protein
MAKLHELLAAEKTPTGAWNQLFEDTLKKFKNPTHFFDGHSKSLKMIEDSAPNTALEIAAREEKPVTTTVFDTLEYALDIFGRAEDLQYQKNTTNRKAGADLMWRGEVLVKHCPIDELLGLEARLTKLRLLIAEAPTLDATKHWQPQPQGLKHVWELRFPEETTKTEKKTIPHVVVQATKEHPAQVQLQQKDEVIGRYTLLRRCGAATALQKAEGLKRIDELLVEIKQARTRANEAEVDNARISASLIPILLAPFQEETEGHQ